ncbi:MULTISPECIES: DUF4190 domain-containing protein [unclassified Arthrobacter]|uniref:DUF4190 domain-containing protein n=1 Tax=unclassified Arthrobacter TaxID=235627 RepID=UPI001D0005DA|nr:MULTISPECIES: DUF4190 domain-containing protein [unclassified Arthrobacter]MCB5283234.1 hypothetical protein [Arthrobacter sp. ES1]WGZ79269.1 DUF4190 domain-containing protein [Arthrobacter sp. EM1]
MSEPVVQARTSTNGLNRLSVAAIIFAVIAAAGVWFFGSAVVAVFAVGAGHMALSQIRLKGERGRGLAIGALAIGYGIGTFALISTLMFIPGAVQQLVN